MAVSTAPTERPDPLANNLRGTLLIFIAYHCAMLLQYLVNCFYGIRFSSNVFEPSYYADAYSSFELMQSMVYFVVTVIGLFLILVRDPRTRGWWITFGRVSVVLGVAHIWLVRALPHQHLRPIAYILAQHGFVASTVWLTYWAMSARVKLAFGPHYAQPEVSSRVLGTIATIAIVIALLVRGAGKIM